MKIPGGTLRDFRQQLSKLFYAMAAIDGTVREEELDELKKIVKREWQEMEATRDGYGTDAADYILITFERLRENNWNIKNAISQFKAYKKDHQILFTDVISELILKTSYAIASAFAKRNKAEMVLFSQIEVLLKQKNQG